MEKVVCDALADVNISDDDGFTELHQAAMDNDVHKMKNLLSLGVDINVRTKYDKTPLHWAMLEDDYNFETIKFLLENGADVNAQCESNETPLHTILYWGPNSIKSIELIMKYNPDFKVIGSEDETTLSRAARLDYFDIVKLLLDYGADVNVQNLDESTALHDACNYNYVNTELIKYLVKKGADFYANDKYGRNPLELLSHNKIQCEAIMKFLFKYSYISLINPSDDDIYFMKYSQSVPMEIILKQVAIFCEVNSQVHSSILDIYSSENCRYSSSATKKKVYFDQCKDELSAAKHLKLKNSWITYFNLLVGTKRNLKNYAGNEDLIIDFKNSDCLDKFPIFGAEMQKNVEKGIKRRELFDTSSIVLSNFLPVFNPNHLIIRDILDCISTKNLSKLNE